MEIGVFEGRSACWMFENVLRHPESRYFGIDCWKYSGKHDDRAVEERARGNLAPYGARAELILGQSDDVLRQARWERSSIDIAYIDGEHYAPAVLADSVLTWPLMKIGGIVVWDDYGLRRRMEGVRRGVNAFLSCMDGTFEPYFEASRQLAVKKVA